MSAATITALASAVVAVLGAAGALIKVIRHSSDPAAHSQPPEDPKP